MIIFDENIEPYIFDSIYTPTHIEYFYIINTDIMEFTLTPLLALEELICPALLLEFNNFKFFLPTSYFILIYAAETSEVDTIQISDITNNDLPIFAYNGETDKMVDASTKVLDYIPEYKFVMPFLNKNQFLCHPIGPKTWINITPQDQYKKIAKLVIGDFII